MKNLKKEIEKFNYSNEINSDLKVPFTICLKLAYFAHNNQYKNEYQYMLHIENCFNLLSDIIESKDGKIISEDFNWNMIPIDGIRELIVIKDVTSKTDITLEEIYKLFIDYGFNSFFKNYLEKPLLLLDHKSETYDEYINKVLKDENASLVRFIELIEEINIMKINNLDEEKEKELKNKTHYIKVINEKWNFFLKFNIYSKYKEQKYGSN